MRLAACANLSMRAREWNGELVFLHESPGSAPENTMPAGQADLNQVTEEDRLPSRPAPLGPAHRVQLADFIEAVRTGRLGSSGL